ncbi:MAG TPA: hypothetical protein VGH87_23650 [Polyangiaceae bacterium]
MKRALLLALSMGCTPAPSPTTTSSPQPLASSPPAVHDAGVVATGKARIDLGLRRPQFFLGENVLVDFCVVNTSDDPFKIEVGGDYRGSSRSLRFKVQVRDASGALVADPDPEPMNFGGIGYSPEIAPGKRWCQSLPLMRYARIEAPGTYTITATHDLGWKGETPPMGTATVKLVMPTAAQADAVVANMASLPADPNGSAGKVSIEYQDFSTPRFNAYVLPLGARAKAGDARAIDGLTWTPTEEATRALVILLGAPNADVARAAARGLAMRLPDPALNGALGKRNPFEGTYAEQRKYLGKAWVPSLANDVRTAAKTRLASSDVRDQQDGAFMLEALGEPADGPSLITALDDAIAKTRTTPAETNVYPVPRGACQELLRATEILVARGLPAAPSPHSPGQVAVWLFALGKAKPAGWEGEMTKLLRHAVPYVRELALDHVPAGSGATFATDVAANLSSADPDVVVAAAKLAERDHMTALGTTIAGAMPKMTGIRLNIVSNAAYALGAKVERANALVALLATKETFADSMRELVGIIGAKSFGSNGDTPDAERAALQTKWKAFLAAHKTEVQTGATIPMDKTLLPSNWTLD